MQFENRPPDEGINAQPEHLGREAVWLICGAIACVVLLVVLADVGARWLAPRLPFSFELALAERMDGPERKLAPEEVAANAELQALADRLRGPLGLPDDITVRVRVDSSEVVNAYATVGGRIFIHRGLLRRLRGEDELTALLAHEMAHVQHRHVAASLGRGLAIGVVLSVVSADAGGRAASVLLEQTGGLMMRGYGRDHEREADAGAMRATAALQGHVGGVIGLFEHIASARSCTGKPAPDDAPSDTVPGWLSTHPTDVDRSEAARTWAREHGVPLSGASPAMTPALLAWAQGGRDRCQKPRQP